MGERVLFLTGRLAHPSLSRVLESLQTPETELAVRDLGLSVAALMTTEMIRRRLKDIEGAERIVVPGLCGGAVEKLSEHFGVPVIRGPKDLKDLPEFLGHEGVPPDLSRHSITIFAEIVDAPHMSLPAIVAAALAYRDAGADVIDLGCLPGTEFAHLEDAITALHAQGLSVSVDSMRESELLRAGRAHADYLLSLKETTLWIADEVPSTPVLIPERPGDLDSLCRAIEWMVTNERAFFADPILDPVHFGLTDSIVRYHELRRRLPQAPIMMGTGNVTELTDSDTTGVTGVLLGIASELDVRAVLTTQVSPHARSAVREIDVARRMMHAAKRDASLPRGYHAGLMALRDRKPFPYSAEEIAETAAAIKDPSFRVQLSAQGIHVYNRDGLHRATDPYALFSKLKLEDDAPHAFYMGVELARAEMAWQLGKRYAQDQPLEWGCAVERDDSPPMSYQAAGSTVEAARRRKKT